MCAFLDRGLSVSEVVSGLQIEENGADLTQRLGGNQMEKHQPEPPKKKTEWMQVILVVLAVLGYLILVFAVLVVLFFIALFYLLENGSS